MGKKKYVHESFWIDDLIENYVFSVNRAEIFPEFHCQSVFV